MILEEENRCTLKVICPNAALSTTNIPWACLGYNPALRGERPASNHLSHGAAVTRLLSLLLYLYVINLKDETKRKWKL
jgi:hypothetical protein